MLMTAVLCAPLAAFAQPMANRADTQRRVILKSVDTVPTTLNSDGSIPWGGTLLVKTGLNQTSTRVGFRSNASDTIGSLPKNQWNEVEAKLSPNQSGVPAGYQRFDFNLDRATVRAGAVTGALWRNLEIQLISVVTVKDQGGTAQYWDHNGPNVPSANNPDSNYVLRYDLNGLKYQAP
jgi:hypothetical protein